MPKSRLLFWGPWLVLGLISLNCLALIGPHFVSIPYRIFQNYNEGWNAYQALRAFSPDLSPPLTH